MSRRHAIQLVPVVQYGSNTLNLRIGLLDLMHPAQQDIDVRIDGGRLLNDVLHAGMRATNNQNHSLWTLDGQRQLLQLQSARRCGDTRINIPGATSVLWLTGMKLARGQGVPPSRISGGWPP
jgi:hypothetical protein